MVYTSCLTSYRTTKDLRKFGNIGKVSKPYRMIDIPAPSPLSKIKVFPILAKNLRKTEIRPISHENHSQLQISCE